ncbi:hypothetical protein [Streptomyces sp. NPDC002889]|uniref:hypothetical protein n=1 Tax=Streptomyces sp. NPDC002889 TaxID=3364669 RepID=UPI0036A38D64
MRKSLTATAFVLAAALLTGCGNSGDGGESGDKAGGKDSAAQQSEKPKDSTAERITGEGTPHEVTIEVLGTGEANVMWTLDDSGFEKKTLPWKETATIAAVGAEQKVGRLVIVTPGTIMGPDSKLVGARCSITVDGKVVAKSADDSGKPCRYMLK